MKKVKIYVAFLFTIISVILISFTASAEFTTYTDGYYTYSILNGEAFIKGVDNSISGDVSIPDKLGGYPVTHINDYSFSDCQNLTSVAISNNIKYIGYEAFSYCTNLKSVNVGDSIEIIETRAFTDCKKLSNIILPNKEIRLCPAAFFNTEYYNNKNYWDNNSLYIGRHLIIADYNNSETYVVKKDTISIGGNAFIYPFTNVILPEGLLSISDFAFSNLNISEIKLPESLIKIDDYVFSGCKKLTNITIPKNVEFIGKDVFSECLNLTKITVDPENKNYSDKDGVLFNKNKTVLLRYPCEAQTKYIIPESVTDIADRSFSYCEKLESITFPNNIKYIGSFAFLCCNNLKNIHIPSNTKIIGSWAFQNCTNLTNLTISNDVIDLYIGESAFSNTKLTNIILPKGVVEIYYCAFSDCNNMTDITILNPNAKMYDYEGNIIPSNTTIHGYKDSTAEKFAKEFNRNFVIIENSHTHQYTKIVTVPTCTTKGYTTYSCSCGDTYTSDIISARHIESDWIISKEATLFESGLKFIECTVCHQSLKISIIPKLTSNEISDGDFTLIFDKETFDSEIKLNVREVTEDFSVHTIAIRGYNNFQLYDITITTNNVKVQPNKKVWVKIPIPKNYDESRSSVYYVDNENGELIKMVSFVKDGYIYFETDHFSPYVLVDESKKTHIHTDNDKNGYCDECDADINPALHCSCGCHKSGIAKFFWSIGNFFKKIFGKGKVCTCGRIH